MEWGNNLLDYLHLCFSVYCFSDSGTVHFAIMIYNYFPLDKSYLIYSFYRFLIWKQLNGIQPPYVLLFSLRLCFSCYYM